MKRLVIACAMLSIASLAFAFGSRESGDFSYDGITRIEIEGDTFDVRIQGTRSRTTTLEIVEYSDKYTVLHSRSGDSLRVWVEREFSLFSRSRRGELVFNVPGDATLRIDNSTGGVTIRNIHSDILNCETSTGDIMIEDGSADYRVHSATGDVEMEECSGDFDVNTSTGDIFLSDISGPISATSSTGDQEYHDIVGDLDARSTTGDIEIDGLSGTLHLTTSTGKQYGRDIELTGDCSFETSTGSIEMDFDIDVEELEFDLTSTTGSLRVGREESQRRLFLGARGFRISGKTSTGSQRYY
jgi:hypothetical protein